MRVVVIGATGVFGRRLAELLVRDGHELWLGGRRSQPLNALAKTLEARALVMDRCGPLEGLWAVRPDVVVDAAGPFHNYGSDPYRLAREGIARGVHYLDLSDTPSFCAGISILDAAAREKGVVVLSGVSSVPGLSSSAVAALAQGEAIDTIESSILPGNRAPRGRSVIESILHQVGQSVVVSVDGRRMTEQSWSDRRQFDLGAGVRRWGYLIAVPDQMLFPDFFSARTVRFHAGLELEVLNRGLAILGWARRRLGARLPTGLIALVARLVSPFGTDIGGMQVAVTLRTGERRIWRMRVRRGDGPYIPGVTVRALLRDFGAVPPGARPALAEMPLEKIEEAMADLSTETERDMEAVDPLFQRVLGADFELLPEAVRAMHDTRAIRLWRGEADVKRGRGIISRIIAALFGFPPARSQTPVEVRKVPRDAQEIWVRRFGARSFRSTLARGPHGMTERFGAFTFDLGLNVAENALHFPVRAGRIGPIPLPRWALPQSVTTETELAGTFHFDVAILAPITGQLVVHYRGWLVRAATEEECG